MIKNYEHIAIIPARKNSIGYPKKNRIFFNHTKEFLRKIKWFKKIYLSSDDLWFEKHCKINNYQFLKRDKKLCKSNTSIKKVMVEIVRQKKIDDNCILWLIYIPLIPKSKKLFEKGKSIIQKKGIKSICGFTKVETHPYLTWYSKNNKIYKYCKNNIYRRQDLPKAMMHNHIISAFKCGELKYLNDELINKNTKPIFVKNKIKEID
tara:strand:- start:7447 stop:8064 length:618 start_codon:yes stop_codon:yes gene_type:complete